jgi:hypothetical protein
MFGRRNKNRRIARQVVEARPIKYAQIPMPQQQQEVSSVIVDDPNVAESAETAAKPVIVGRGDQIFGVKVVNTDTSAGNALILDAYGTIANDLSYTEPATISITSPTHDYASFLEGLKNSVYKVRKIVFRSDSGDEAVLDNSLKLYNYNNGIGVANVNKKIVPSSGVSGNQYNLNVYEILTSFKMDGFLGGFMTIPADTTLNIYFYFE